MIYIASPYSHPDAEVREARYRDVLNYTSTELQKGLVAFSPIVYGHPFAVDLGHAFDHRAWLLFNESLMLRASSIQVLCLPGWLKSKGVSSEIAFAERLRIPVSYIEVDSAGGSHARV